MKYQFNQSLIEKIEIFIYAFLTVKTVDELYNVQTDVCLAWYTNNTEINSTRTTIFQLGTVFTLG